MRPATSEETTRPARPIVKWAGGKTSLISEIEKHVPAHFERYYEGFAGGAALFFHLAATRPGLKATIGDLNKALVTTYKCVRDDVDEVVARLRRHEAAHAKKKDKFFYDLRAAEPVAAFDIAARFVALNKLGFNGLYRVNLAGKFNVPYGKWANTPTVCDEDNLRAATRVLRGATIEHGDFEKITASAKRGDFCYFDPPYVPLSASADFTTYTKEPFGPAEQERLRDVAIRLKKRGIRVLLSNSDTPEVRKLYKFSLGFSLEKVEARRNINSRAGKRGPVGELLIW